MSKEDKTMGFHLNRIFYTVEMRNIKNQKNKLVRGILQGGGYAIITLHISRFIGIVFAQLMFRYSSW